jgi:hypothetical protein
MKPCTLAVLLSASCLASWSCAQAPEGSLRYLLPVQDAHAGEGTAGRWGLAAPAVDGFSDPNRIIYDQAYVDAYVAWAMDTPIVCGAATYRVVTKDGVVEFTSGLDATYLGTQFRAEDLMRFLRTRTEGKAAERTFRVKRPDAGELLRGQPESFAGRRLRRSPRERDTEAVVDLLALARHRPAFPLFRELLKDADPALRTTVVLALGRLTPVVPEAVEELNRLLLHKELGADAVAALAMAGPAAVAVFVKAMDHPDETVRNRAVFGLGRIDPFEAAVPGLLAALDHKDRTLREWALSVVIDLQTKGVAVGKDEVVDALARRLLDGDDRTRSAAVIALVNLKAAAARARPALEKAAANDPDGTIRQRARAALQAIDAGTRPDPETKPGPAAEAPPRIEPRVQAFVAYLERNGVKLVRGESGTGGGWSGPGGLFKVRVLACSPGVRGVDAPRAGNDGPAHGAQPSARIAITRDIALATQDEPRPEKEPNPSTRDTAPPTPDRPRPEGMKALEERLRGLLHSYQSPADVVAGDRQGGEGPGRPVGLVERPGGRPAAGRNPEPLITYAQPSKPTDAIARRHSSPRCLPQRDGRQFTPRGDSSQSARASRVSGT